MRMYEAPPPPPPPPSDTIGAQVLSSMKSGGSLNQTISSLSPTGANADFNMSPGTARSSPTSESSQEGFLTHDLNVLPSSQIPRSAARTQDQGRKRDRKTKNRCSCKIAACQALSNVPVKRWRDESRKADKRWSDHNKALWLVRIWGIP